MHDLGQLSDYDFERIVADLLASEWQVRVEYFPKGRDGGVDLRVLGPTPAPLNLPPDGELVVQCKHMPQATIVQLRGVLSKEASKPIVGEAYRYVFVTSARITRSNKREIAAIFAGRLSEIDILGRDDIDALLRNHPEVVRANMKLWLASGTALQAFLNQVEYLRSSVLQVELEQLRPKLVQTSVVTKAQELLAQVGVCILSGAPGVGKTTTAKILLLRYLSEGWRPAVAISDVREFEAQLLPDVKQVLFFDDFLGVTALQSKLTQGDDSALVRLIHLIENDPSKVFILTTRDYILRQAQQTYEKLNDDAFSVAKLIVNIESITQAERAHILYNQLFFSPLRFAAAASPDGPSQYMKLTRHRNYNPRLIEAAIATASREIGIRSRRYEEVGKSDWINISDGKYPDVPTLLNRALDHPENLWKHVFLHQLTQLQREILVVRLSLGSASVDIADFLEVVLKFYGTPENKVNRIDLDMALKVLDGDLLSVTKPSPRTKQLLINGLYPGVADSLIAMLREYPDYLQMLIASASTFEQVRWLAEFLGIGGYHRVQQGRTASEYARKLVDCAERNFAASPIAMSNGLVLQKPLSFSDIGIRLEVLSNIYAGADESSTADFADRIVPQFLEVISLIPNAELLRMLKVLRKDVFRAWRWRRTEINVAVLNKLTNPSSAKEWSVLREVLDLVGATPEYCEDLESQFEEFLEDSIMDAHEVIEEANEENDVDLPIDELEELNEVAYDWGAFSPEIDSLLDEMREIQDRRDEAEAKQQRHEREQNKLALFEAPKAMPEGNASIFEKL